MDTPSNGIFGALSEFIQSAGHFAYENIGLTLLLLWCFILFAMTEFAKPFIKHMFRNNEEERVLFVKAFPQAMGAVTGYWFFPTIVNTTKWGATWKMPGFVGIGAGFLFGIVTIGFYNLSKNGKVIRLTKIVTKKFAKKIPFLSLTDDEIEFIAETTAGLPTSGVNDLQRVIVDLKSLGDVTVTVESERVINLRVELKQG